MKISEIRVKTHVSMFFTWEELESPLPRPSNVPDADGMTDMADQWRTGTVTKIWQNRFRKKCTRVCLTRLASSQAHTMPKKSL